MGTAIGLLGTAGQDIISFLAWLGIHPSLQDLVKAGLLVVFVLAILMVVGDVYRGEIQNKIHRVILGPTVRGEPLSDNPRREIEIRRRLRREKDIFCQVPQTLVPLTQNEIFSNVLFYFRYRDTAGRLHNKLIQNYRCRFHVRKNALPRALAEGHEADHHYSEEENDRLPDEEKITTISLAASRVDYINMGKIEPLMEKEQANYEKLRARPMLQALAGIRNGGIHKPEALGLAVKFHFPINPYFLLYRHPDTNVRTTAWLTVLTSAFALFIQLIYAGTGTATASARAPTEHPPIIEQTASRIP